MSKNEQTKSVQQQMSDLFNSLSFEDRCDKAGIGYSLAQLTTIIQIRQINKDAWKNQDRKLSDWQKNIERNIMFDFKELLND